MMTCSQFIVSRIIPFLQTDLCKTCLMFPARQRTNAADTRHIEKV